MGTDIHFYVEHRKDGRWHSADTWEPDEYWSKDDETGTTSAPLTVPYGKHFYEDRNYDLFAILADVRNGSGFAGIKTSAGFNIISKPRGLPHDLSPELAAEFERGIDHTPSWLTLAEILAFDWTQVTQHQGSVSAHQYFDWNIWRRRAGQGPDNYSGGVFGNAVTHVDEDEMRRRVQVVLSRQGVGGDADGREAMLLRKLGIYCLVTWTETYSHSCQVFWSDTIPRLLRLGKPEDVRAVFYFDS